MRNKKRKLPNIRFQDHIKENFHNIIFDDVYNDHKDILDELDQRKIAKTLNRKVKIDLV